MVEEATAVDAEDAGEDAEAAAEAQGETQAESRRGTEFVDFSELPDDARKVVEPRFKRLYGNMKQYERQFQQISQAHQALLQHNQMLAERMQQLETGLSKDRTESMQAQLVKAAEEGDVETVRALTEKLAKAGEPAKQQAYQQPQQQAGSQLGPQQIARIESWASETDDDGGFVRDWALPGHPRQQEAGAMLMNYLSNGYDLEQSLGLVDRKMTGTTTRKATAKPNGADPTPSGNAPGKRSRKTELSPEQVAVARKMGLKPEDYAKQLGMLTR